MPILLSPTITETYFKRVRATPHAPAFEFKPKHPDQGDPNRWKTITWAEHYPLLKGVAYGLMGLGLKSGEKVALLANTRMEWSLCDLAVMCSGGVTVPIYPSNTADDVAYIIAHSESRYVFLEDSKQLEKIIQVSRTRPDTLAGVEKWISFDPSCVAYAARECGPDHALTRSVITLPALQELGKREESRSSGELERRAGAVKPTDLFTICYTSGTTGVPKGVMLTHDSMMSALEDIHKVLKGAIDPENEVLLSFLPFAHILGRMESMTPYIFGWKQGFAESLDSIVKNMSEVRPTGIAAVPRIFEKAYARVQNSVQEGPAVKRMLFDRALATGRRYFADYAHGRKPPLAVRAEYELHRHGVFKQVLARLGGRLRFSLCGGAPLPREIGEFFRIIGLDILEGYGLTETCAPITLNPPEDPRFGTVGKPLPEAKLRIAADGEIQVKSRKVFCGYYKDEQATAQALSPDGWFSTGDIGTIDEDGYVTITDRKKDLIVTSAGKNIAPQKIENLAKAFPLLQHCLVSGDRRPYLVALLTLDREAVIRFANENQILFSDYSVLVKHPRIRSLAQGIIDEVNRQLPSYETVKGFVILPTEFTVDSGELTPSLKLKRNVIQQRYAAELRALYPSESVGQ